MKTEYLTYIKEIAKYGSFNKAAQNLYMSQPALNEAVSSLERELGFKIFQRTHKGVFLTSEGENMFKSIDLVLNTIKSWQDFSTKNKQNNSINIKTFSTVGRIVLSDLIDEMQKNNPQLSIHVYGQFYGDADGLINEIFLQENYDLVILGITAQVLPKMVDFLPIIKKQMKILFHDQYYVVMNANHPLAKKKSLKLKDLTDNILVTHSSDKTPAECLNFFKNYLPKNQYVYLESNVDILT